MWKCKGTRKAKTILKNECYKKGLAPGFEPDVKAAVAEPLGCWGGDKPHDGHAQESCQKQAPETQQQFVCLSVCFKQRSHIINWEKKSSTNDANFSLTAHTKASLWWVIARS